ncbi:TRAP transporter small permease [Alcaligenaceae bacterium]|nr:TRAP transporter small permease [Alcaligenaceae bacterium]
MKLSQLPVVLGRIAIIIAEVLLVILTAITVYSVVARYLFNAPSLYAVEVSAYLLVAITWLSAGWVHHERRHVNVEFAEAKFRGHWKRLAHWISQASVLLFSVVLVWAGTNIVQTAFEKGYKSSSLLRTPLWIPYSLLPIGAAILALIALTRFRSTAAKTTQKGDE